MVVDSEPNEQSLMAYTAVYAYVDTNALTFEDHDNQLHQEPVFDYSDNEFGEVNIEENPTWYKETDHGEWTCIDHSNGDIGPTIHPIPWMGADEQFSVKVTEEKLSFFKDAR